MVSVIIPLYNQGIYVEDAVTSVANQTYRDFEIIIVNDASTDGSLEDAARVASMFPGMVRVINLTENVKLPGARNVGITYANGDLILPLDSDDKIDPTHLEKTVPLMTEGVGVVSTWMEIFGLGREKTGHPGSSYPIFTPTKEQILDGNSLTVCSLVRKQAIYDAGWYPENMKLGSEDWGLWAKIICKTNWKAVVVPEYLFYYRVHNRSMCRDPKRMAPFEENRRRVRELCSM